MFERSNHRAVFIVIAAVGLVAGMWMPTVSLSVVRAQGAPSSLPMGGAKSVTRFFVTSRGLGRGGDLGGLVGADAHCQALANAAGSGDHMWRAYLSTAPAKTTPAVNARDRIG